MTASSSPVVQGFVSRVTTRLHSWWSMMSPLRRTSITALGWPFTRTAQTSTSTDEGDDLVERRCPGHLEAAKASFECSGCSPAQRRVRVDRRRCCRRARLGLSVRAGARGQVEFTVGPTYSADKGPVKPSRAGQRHSGDSRGTADRTATQARPHRAPDSAASARSQGADRRPRRGRATARAARARHERGSG